MRCARFAVGIVSSLAFVSASARAQDCGCDHTLGLEVTEADGMDLGVMPGERVCVTAGTREFLRLQRFFGSEAAPIEVINCGGQVVIHNEDRAYALVVEEDSHHVHVTGTGDDTLTYGFDVSAPDRDPYPGIGVWLNGRSTDIEVDHIEVHHTGFAGVMAKTDPLCDGSADQGVFLQHATRLHHLYVHDTGGEGFYVGSTQSNGHSIMCMGMTEVHQPHFLEEVDIYENLVEDTGWDGMQVGMAHSGCRVYRNEIHRVGLEREMYQQQGLQIGTFSVCDVYENTITDGTANGLLVIGAGDMTATNNVLLRFEGDGVYSNANDVIAGARYRFYFNTIADYGGNAITVFGGVLGASEAFDNLMIGDTEIAVGGDVAWTAGSNLRFASEGEAGVVSPADYHLTETSPARGAGEAAGGVDTDRDGLPRADPPSVGAYEYRDLTVDAGVPPGRDAGSVPPGTDAGTTPTEDGGCGCRAAGGSRRRPASYLAGLLVLVALRRRRR
ncbi:MAG: right-handed parallel beta-helix repeat-containing protein [Sandaracinaceae bacterium]